jgi:SM-20-related protein
MMRIHAPPRHPAQDLTPHTAVARDNAAIAEAAARVAANGYAIVPGFLPAAAVSALATEARRRRAAGEFRAAGIGRRGRRVERGDVRGDAILWLDEAALTAAERLLWDALERLRMALNRATLLGLFAFEGHYALYPPGAFYRRHRDRFLDDDARVLSCVFYLNETWNAADGGALRIHLSEKKALDLMPAGGTLACFLAERYEHEVLPGKRERWSIAGWFRRRSSSGA